MGCYTMSNMYEIIEKLCNAKGIKPGKMCADTGLSRGMITDLKMGRTKELSNKNTKIVADYFGVSVDYLAGNEKPATEDDELKQFEHVRRLSPHKCRHTYATHAIRSGINMRIVQEQLGHQQITTTEIYANVDIEDRKNNVVNLKY